MATTRFTLLVLLALGILAGGCSQSDKAQAPAPKAESKPLQVEPAPPPADIRVEKEGAAAPPTSEADEKKFPEAVSQEIPQSKSKPRGKPDGGRPSEASPEDVGRGASSAAKTPVAKPPPSVHVVPSPPPVPQGLPEIGSSPPQEPRRLYYLAVPPASEAPKAKSAPPAKAAPPSKVPSPDRVASAPQQPGETHLSSTQAIPRFPCNPPVPSTTCDLTDFFSTGITTLAQADGKLRSALEQTGYFDKSYYALDCCNDGFAMVTRLERFHDDGKPYEGDARWKLGFESELREKFSLAKYLRSLTTADPGHYRVIVFVFSRTPTIPDLQQKLSEEKAKEWLHGGLTRLPPSLEDMAYTSDHGCEVLVYQFLKTTTSTDFITHSSLAAKEHLDRSGLLSALQGGGR